MTLLQNLQQLKDKTVHSKTLDDGSVVRVTQDTDQGAVRVEYDSDANVFEDTVQMEYKKPLPDEGDPNPAAELLHQSQVQLADKQVQMIMI